jgi:hypothetical protein
MFPGTEIMFVTAAPQLLEAAKAEGLDAIDPTKLPVAEPAPGSEAEMAKETE